MHKRGSALHCPRVGQLQPLTGLNRVKPWFTPAGINKFKPPPGSNQFKPWFKPAGINQFQPPAGGFYYQPSNTGPPTLLYPCSNHVTFYFGAFCGNRAGDSFLSCVEWYTIRKLVFCYVWWRIMVFQFSSAPYQSHKYFGSDRRISDLIGLFRRDVTN